jgi:hypothetical protein
MGAQFPQRPDRGRHRHGARPAHVPHRAAGARVPARPGNRWSSRPNDVKARLAYRWRRIPVPVRVHARPRRVRHRGPDLATLGEDRAVDTGHLRRHVPQWSPGTPAGRRPSGRVRTARPFPARS